MAEAQSGHSDRPAGAPDEHGNSPAAWTGVTILGVAAVVAAVGLVIGSLPMFFIAAVGGAIIGVVAWVVLANLAKHKPAA